MRLVVLGLSLSSSWGNGHAVTYRALLKALAARGAEILFLERETPWYAAERDLQDPDYCDLAFYGRLDDLSRYEDALARADAVMIGSYTQEGAEVGRWAMALAKGPVVFYDIDTPVTLAGLERGGVDYLAREQIPLYDVYFSFTGGPTLTVLETVYGSPAARALYCSADPQTHRPLDTPFRWDLSYLGTFSEDRQPGLEALLLEPARRHPERRFVVAGPQYPTTIAWPANVERIEHVPPAEHRAFYAASRYTLNLTRADMRRAGFSPSIRLFEAAACGAPIISDVWAGLETLFEPDREIVLARSSADVLRALDMDEDARGGLAAAGRSRVLESHTPDRRALALERELQAARQRGRGGGRLPLRPGGLGSGREAGDAP